MGLKFRRQHRIGPYVVDFACLERGLTVEVDGGQHDEDALQDAARDALLRSRAFQVLRFWNNEVLGQMHEVIEQIWVAASRRPPSLPAPLPHEVRERGAACEFE